MKNLERVKEQCEFANKWLERAEKRMEEGELEEAINAVWLFFENAINVVKDVRNNAPVFSHDKTRIFEFYAKNGVLKMDYSTEFLRLERMRLSASFGQYSNSIPVCSIEELKEFVEKAKLLQKDMNATVDLVFTGTNS